MDLILPSFASISALQSILFFIILMANCIYANRIAQSVNIELKIAVATNYSTNSSNIQLRF